MLGCVWRPLASPNLAEDLLGVRLQLSTQLHAGKVGLQQQVSLHVWVVELGVVQLVGHLLGQLGGGRGITIRTYSPSMSPVS